MPYNQPIQKRFLLLDDQSPMRSALNSVISETYFNAIKFESANGPDIIEELTFKTYDLIILNIQIPNNDSLWFINYIHLEYPATPVLVYSLTAENIYAFRVLRAGAKGFVSKKSSVAELKTAIRLALNRNNYLSQANPSTGLQKSRLY